MDNIDTEKDRIIQSAIEPPDRVVESKDLGKVRIPGYLRNVLQPKAKRQDQAQERKKRAEELLQNPRITPRGEYLAKHVHQTASHDLDQEQS